MPTSLPARPSTAAERKAAAGMLMGVMLARKMGFASDEDVRDQCEQILARVPDCEEAHLLLQESMQRIVRWN